MIYVVGTGLLAETIYAALDEWDQPALFFNDSTRLLAQNSILWFAEDMPVDCIGHADSNNLILKLYDYLDRCPSNTRLIISSQVKVGTARLTQERYPNINVVSVPENSRRGFMLDGFLDPDRVVIGTKYGAVEKCIEKIYPIHLRHRIQWVNYETAEMTKHALNTFLALSIAFANEMDRICRHHHASYEQVLESMKADSRIGQKAYLNSGKADGRHLLRDVRYLMESVSDPMFLPDILRSSAWDN